MNPTRVWRDKAGGWHMTCEAPCCTHATLDDQAMAFEAALGHVAYWHRDTGVRSFVALRRENVRNRARSAAQSPGEWLGHRDEARAQGGTW